MLPFVPAMDVSSLHAQRYNGPFVQANKVRANEEFSEIEPRSVRLEEEIVYRTFYCRQTNSIACNFC
jgi:hypothetical protein